MLCFHEDEFRFETEHPGSQCLLVVGQRAALTPFSINSGFVFGTNTLDFFVTNAFNFVNPTGLRVDHIAGSYQIPEPTALALACGGLIVGCVLRRRRRC